MSPTSNPTPQPDDSLGLATAYQSQRPQRDAFRTAVQQRIAARYEGQAQRVLGAEPVPSQLEWAASMLPPGLLASLSAGTGLSAKKLGLKLLPALVAMPGMVLLMLFGVFAGGLRALRRPGQHSSGLPGNRVALLERWFESNRNLLLGSLLLLLALGLWQSPELVSVFLLISMTITLLLLGELSRAGFGDRVEVARCSARALGWTAFAWAMLRAWVQESAHGTSRCMGIGILLVGWIVCMLVGHPGLLRAGWNRIWHPGERMLFPDRLTTLSLRCIYLGFAIFLSLIIGLWIWVLVIASAGPQPSREDLVAYVESFQEALDAGPGKWAEFAAIAQVLREDGGEEPAYAALAERIAEELKLGRKPKLEGLDALLASLGICAQADFSGAYSAAEKQAVLEQTGKLDAGELRGLRMLVACHDYDAKQRGLMLGRLAASWPAPDSQQPLAATLEHIRMLNELGAGEAIEAQRATIQAALVARWGGQNTATGAAVFRSPQQSPWPEWLRNNISSEDAEITSQALAIMSLVGVPASIDLRRLAASYGQSSQLKQAQWYQLRRQRDSIFYDLGAVQVQAFGPFESSPWEHLQNQRSSIGALLFVMLCLLAIKRSPVGECYA